MNKKCISFIIISILCLNLLPQTCNAFKLNKEETEVIYDSDDEKEIWKTFYMPYAKHLKLVNKTTTMLDLAKVVEAEKKEALLLEIMKCTTYERGKALVRWERDNGYIDTEGEKDLEITPLIRSKMLKEIEADEEREVKEEEQIYWKETKAKVKALSFFITFVVTMFVNKNVKGANKWEIAGKWATTTMLIFSTSVEIWEVIGRWVRKKLSTVEDDEEIKLPPLRNLPELPKNYIRVKLI